MAMKIDTDTMKLIWMMFGMGILLGCLATFMIDHPFSMGNAAWETNISFISKGNIQNFCHANGYDNGYFACSTDVGFTCYSMAGDYMRSHCFTLEELRPQVKP